MFDAVVPAAFDDMEETGDVALHVHVGILDRVAHPRLGGQVHHALEFLAGKHRLHGGAVGNVDLREAKAIESGQNLQSRRFQRRVVVAVEVVDADDLVTQGEQRLRGVKPDEPRRARDEQFHNRRQTVFPREALSSSASTSSWALISSSLARTTAMEDAVAGRAGAE